MSSMSEIRTLALKVVKETVGLKNTRPILREKIFMLL